MEQKIAIIGKGNVGSSLLQLLNDKKDEIEKMFDISYKVMAIFEYDGALINEDGIDLEEVLKKEGNFRELSYWKKDIVAKEQISKLDIDICIETTPTNPNTGEPALSHIIEALCNKINVVTSNKAPFY